MWLKDTGILERVKYDVLKPGIEIPDPKVRRHQPLILRQLAIIMIVLVIGLFLSTIGFLVELSRRQKLTKTIVEKDLIENITFRDTHEANQTAYSSQFVFLD